MQLTIIGTGYVGLVSGACFAEIGHTVTCLDIDNKKIVNLRKGAPPFYEPELAQMLLRHITQGNISFTTSYKVGCKNQLIFLCLDTPPKNNGNLNLSTIFSAIKSISNNLTGSSIVVTKSTVPLGTNKILQSKFDTLLKGKKHSVEICANPEFLREGSAIKDFLKPDRIIVGINSLTAKKVMQDVYKPLNTSSRKTIMMSPESAELTKYAANSFLATKISFINEMAMLAEHNNANIHDIKRGIGSDRRIGNAFLNAGLGFGGSCFPKDIRALIAEEKKANLTHSIIKSAYQINQSQLEFFHLKIKNFYKGSLKKKNLLIWGLAFKPNTDDLRDSLAIKLIRRLAPQVNELALYDPVASCKAKAELKKVLNITFISEPYEEISSMDALVICTEWSEFSSPMLNELQKLRDAVVFDGRNILQKSQINKAGLQYFGIGV
ncbi:UDP-glucose/GDP-mannose dehydrogenase family protein [Gammaproteobacteria bacterium]|nr:UDP-glucose/GDP-mannose dehydrogenase family protein [Gammaproteobacteria bacterium]